LLLLAIIILSFSWPALNDQFQNQRPKSSSATTLKIISFNWLGNNTKLLEAQKWITNQNADIVVIQEFSQHTEGLGTHLYPHFPYRTKAEGDIIILSKHPLTKEKTHKLDKQFLVEAVMILNDQVITLYGLHPSTLRNIEQVAARNAYLSEATKILSKNQGPKIVLGDFNAARWDPWFSRFANRLRLHEEPRLFPLNTRLGIRSGLKSIGAPIDHIMVSDNNHIGNCKVGPLLGSDHTPLICHVTLKTTTQ
jgi:endonuclease/exonuclease/phosphatase (EEP) superfamily protein YafD